MEGRIEGCALGSPVGPVLKEGIVEGEDDGSVVAVGETDVEGESEGSAVGNVDTDGIWLIEGLSDGNVVGRADGFAVGTVDVEGSAVGILVERPTWLTLISSTP
mmetsp:Transcript_13269/g.28685  ORF Transcript_13269/g.28685 Transcript_13269/m.28685 type:complete len:104 (-) Transcript_13269:1350-1661(-)